MSDPLQYSILLAGVVILAVIFIVVLRKRSKDAPAKDPYIDALQLLIDGDRDGAYAKLQQSVRRGGAPADAYIKLGNLLRERGEPGKALQIHQGLTVKTNLSRDEKIELYLNLADDYAQLGNSDKLVRVLETAIKNLDINEPRVYLTLAKHYHRLGQRDKVLECLKDARKYGAVKDRELALYLTSIAETLLDQGHVKDAKKFLHRALKYDPDCAPSLMVLGNIAENESDLDEAIQRWRQVALLSPQLAESVLGKLERTLYQKGRFGDIEQVYNDVCVSRAGDETASLSLAAFYKKQGRGEEAIQLLEEFLVNNPRSVRGALLLTSLYARYRDPETLERFLDESFRKSWRKNDFICRSCGHESSFMRWHCPKCNAYDSFSRNHES